MNENETLTRDEGFFLVRVPSDRAESFESELSKINRKLEKKGILSRVSILSKGAPELSRVYDPRTGSVKRDSAGRERKIETIPYRIELPKLALSGDWRLIGALDHESGDRAIVKALPGEVLPEALRSATADRCDYCNKIRRRVDTFAVQSSAGEIKIVGRNCIADFLGINVEGILYSFDLHKRLIAMFSEAEDPDSERFGGRVQDIAELGDFLTFAALVIRQTGYVSKREAQSDLSKQATAPIVWQWYITEIPKDRFGAPILAETVPADRDRELAAAAETWIKGLSEAELSRSEYLYNLRVIVDSARVTSKTSGFAASLIPSYQRELDREAGRVAERKQAASSKHIGTPKERIKDLPVTVLSVRALEGIYGTCYLVKLRDSEGNDLTWFASNDPENSRELGGSGVKIGETYQADLTVKAHDTYKGSKQTKITRVSFKLEGGKA